MAFFHLKTVPGYAWPALPDAVFARCWNAYLELDRTQWLSTAEIAERQLEQARTLLAHCITRVPYYREVLPKAGIVPGAIRTMDDFRRIPFLLRRTYQERTADFQAEQLPAGTQATGIVQTSGSTGSPTTVFQTNVVDLWWYAFYLRDLEWCGIDPTGVLASIRSSGKKGADLERMLGGMSAPCWMPALDPFLHTGPAHLMDVSQDPRQQLQWLRQIAPTCLLSYSANLEALAHLASYSGPLPSLKTIHSIATTLLPETKTLIEKAFGVPVSNTYSCFEAGYLASPCVAGKGLHVHAENVILEVLDERDQPCRPGQTGRIVITTLHNLRAPFIRYDLGDEATVGPAEKCSCGRGLPLLASVQGKNRPMFHLPDGRHKNSISLGVMIRQQGGHWQYQVIQQAEDRVLVRLAIDATWTDAHGEAIKRCVREFFEAPIRVEVEALDRLPLPLNGKLATMINEIHPQTSRDRQGAVVSPSPS